MERFKRYGTNGFNYVYERELKAGEEVIVQMPAVTANKRGINDVGWQSDGDITISGTLSTDPDSDKALWQEINDRDEINKTVSAIKIKNNGSACTVVLRAIFN